MILALDMDVILPSVLIFITLLFAVCLISMEKYRRNRTASVKNVIDLRHRRILDQAAKVQSSLEDTTRKSQEMNRHAQEERERINIIRYGVDVQGGAKQRGQR